MARQKLILLASEKMGSNKKEDRNENGLVRMSARAREHLGFAEDNVEVCKDGSGTSSLEIFHAFSDDLKILKELTEKGSLSPEDKVRVGFVTAHTLKQINGRNAKQVKNIWISDTAHDVVMGSDPEFLLFNREDGRVMRANEFLSRNGELASDGAMAEIRPKPAITAEEHVQNIHALFKSHKARNSITDYKWACACYHVDDNRDYPVGGHIHVGNPAKIARWSMENRDAFFIVFNKILDELLAVPLTKLDGIESGKNRRTNCRMSNNGGYGYFGEWRNCNGRLEHRTLSGMWLLHPSVAKATLGTAKAIIDEVLRLVAHNKYDKKYMCLYPKGNNPRGTNMWKKGFNGWKDVQLSKDMKCTSSSGKIISLLNESDPDRINSTYLKDWLSTMKGLSTYKNNSKNILGLYEILNISAGQLHRWDREIQKNWLTNKKFMVEV